MNNNKILANILEEFSECKNLLNANKDSELYGLAQAILKVLALVDYKLFDHVIVADPAYLSDTSNVGILSESIMNTCDTMDQFSTYLIPLCSGKIKFTNESWELSAVEIEVKANLVYKYVVGEGFKEVL